MNRLPEPIEHHEPLWLEMYADGELDSMQIERLFGYLDLQDEIVSGVRGDSAWKRMALTLVREQRIAADVAELFGDHAANHLTSSGSECLPLPSLKEQKKLKRIPWHPMAWVAAAAFFMGAFALLGYQQLNSTRDMTLASQHDPANSLRVPATHSGTENSSFAPPVTRPVSFPHDENAHTIFEVENTATTATYYLNKSIPDLLLQSLVLAGHSVEVGQESIAVQTESGKSLSVPISTLHIKKFAKRF